MTTVRININVAIPNLGPLQTPPKWYYLIEKVNPIEGYEDVKQYMSIIT